MADSTPDPAEQPAERSFGDSIRESEEAAAARAITRHQAQLRRNATIVTVDREDDGLYAVSFRYLSHSEAERLIRLSRRVRPVPPAGARALRRLAHAPHLLDRPRPRAGGRPPKLTARTIPQYVKALRQTIREWRSLNQQRLPDKKEIFNHAGSAWGYTTYRGWQGFITKLEAAGYTWPDAYL
jgi:hypothetical protein